MSCHLKLIVILASLSKSIHRLIKQIVMKTTKVMIPIMIAFMFVFFSGNIFAQTIKEVNATMTIDHQSVMKHATAISSGEAKNLNDQILHYNEARRSFADAKKSHTLLKKGLSARSRSAAIIHHDNIDKQHLIATTLANAMASELKNDATDDAKLKELARKLYAAISIAEKEHLELIKDIK
jgi:hypothetical protein